MTRTARAVHGLVALLAAIGILLEYTAILAAHPGNAAGTTLRFLSYFTILSNLAVTAAGAGIAAAPGRWSIWAEKPDTRACTAVYISVVAIIFQFLLAGLQPLSPIGWWGNMLVHQLVPAAWILCWIGFAPHGGIAATAPLRWLIFPALYGAWTLVHGAASGFYPYPFVNVARFGYGAAVRNMALTGLLFLMLGSLYRWIDARLARRASG